MTSSKNVQALCRTLSEEYILQLKTQNFHWNVEGPSFFSLHKLFEEQYKEISELVDRAAEVIRAHNVKAPGSFKEFQKIALIDEAPAEALTSLQMIEILSKDHHSLAVRLGEHLEEAEKINDTAAVVLYEDLISFHEKAAWMIRSHRNPEIYSNASTNRSGTKPVYADRGVN
jgi:DNA-binding ferritin-like protein (oxidative damage protectant)